MTWGWRGPVPTSRPRRGRPHPWWAASIGCFVAAPAWAAPLTGHVFAWPEGTPLLGVSVVAADRTGRSFGTQADADGSYVIDVPPGQYRVAARPGATENRLPAWWDDQYFFCGAPLVDTRDGPAGAVDFHLPQGGAIEGEVLDTRGDALSNATVRAEGLDFLSQNLRRSATTDEHGAFRIVGLDSWTDEAGPLPGHYRLSAWRAGEAAFGLESGWAPAEGVPVEVVRRATTTVTLRAPKGTAAAGTVVDEDGQAVPAARVEAWTGGSAGRAVMTESDGRFRFEALAGRSLTLRVSAEDRASLWFPGGAPGAPAAPWPLSPAELGLLDVGPINLPRGAELELVGLQDESPGTTLRLTDAAGQWITTTAASSPGAGAIVVEGLPVGVVRWSVHPGPDSRWIRPGPSGELTLSAGARATLEVPRLDGEPLVVGVLDGGGGVLPSAEVEVWDGESSLIRRTTDADGWLEIAGLPDRPLRVDARYPTFCPNDPGYVSTADQPIHRRPALHRPGSGASITITLLDDSDQDGIDDTWELAHGLDPSRDDADQWVPDGSGTWRAWYLRGDVPRDGAGCAGPPSPTAAYPLLLGFLAGKRRRSTARHCPAKKARSR